MKPKYELKEGMIYDPEDGQTIASMSDNATPEQGELLAAAPELLEALQGWTDEQACCCEVVEGPEFSCLYCQSIEAIKKATGAE